MRTTNLWNFLHDKLQSQKDVFLAFVADHTRHSPGTRGAKLMLCSDGEHVGTIGGGMMEKRLLDEGAQALLEKDTFEAWAKTLHHRREGKGEKSGMICAGEQTIVAYIASGERDLHAVRAVLEHLEADRAGLLRIQPETGLSFEAGAENTGIEHFITLEKESGTTNWCYTEQILNLQRAVIFGGGHCGLALSRQLEILGYTVTIADNRPDLFTLQQNTWAHHVITGEDFSTFAARVRHPELTCAIVMTADFPSDTKALHGALKQPFPFLGLMGAPAKLKAIRQVLQKQGCSEEEIEHISAPVGVSIGSSTPEEIAVSVAAQLIALRPELFPYLAPSPLFVEQEI